MKSKYLIQGHIVPINIQMAEKYIHLLATSFFHQDFEKLNEYFSISPLQADEAFDTLRDFLNKEDFTSLSPPPPGNKTVMEEDEVCADDENASIRIYPLNCGGWGYEMDVFSGDMRSDLTMRGELPEDFCENPRSIRFHLFEVM